MTTYLLRIGIVLALSATSLLRFAQATPNPYGVAGWGVLSKLGMPADCLDYDWNNLHPGTLCQMCRPNHYYEYVGIPPRWWGWNQNTGQINDPDQFAAWIAANPGRVWIIGNEPDLQSQDGLTPEQYAQMYKTYYDFIKPRDPTAKFCIGAITGGSTTAAFNYTKNWYETVLNYYKNTYGEPMPIDIWNIHSYCGAAQIENPDQPINDFIIPFINWCHTVDGGRYANAEVWITELPIGEWMGALNQEWIIWFAQRYLPRLERAGVNRWFWYVSKAWNDPSGDWGNVSLVSVDGTVSPLGYAYAALAHGYPNEVPPVTPYVPDPTPPYFEDKFSSGPLSHPWMVKAGKWAIENGVMRQSRVGYAWWGETAPLQYIYEDFDMTFKVRINNAIDASHWAGVFFHLTSRFHTISNSGYLVFMRRNGAIGLHNGSQTVSEIPNAVPDATQFQTIRIRMEGWRIQVYANGNLIIDWTDSAHRTASGYIALCVYKTDSSFDDVQIIRLPNTPTITDDGAFQTSTTMLHAVCSNTPPWGAVQYQYAIGTTPGGTDIVNWTNTSGPEITRTDLSLTLGKTYYISMKFCDANGVWSYPGSSDGITVVSATGTPGEIKNNPTGTLVGFSGIVTANANNITRAIFVEAPDRSSAIRVYQNTGVPNPDIGSIVHVVGKLAEISGERVIGNTSLTIVGSAPEPIKPIFLPNKAIGGGALNPYTPGITNGYGPYNIALLVQTSGKVLYVDPVSKLFFIDDGSDVPNGDRRGVAVSYDVVSGTITPPSVGQNVIVTGLSAIRNYGGNRYPLIRLRSQSDINIVN
jgi:hypothetical protein